MTEPQRRRRARSLIDRGEETMRRGYVLLLNDPTARERFGARAIDAEVLKVYEAADAWRRMLREVGESGRRKREPAQSA